jgi:hypothetical protein
MIDEAIYCRCNCGAEVLRFGIFTFGEGNEWDGREFAVNIYESRKSQSIINRLQYIWHIIRTGTPYGDQVLLGCEEFLKLKKFLNKFDVKDDDFIILEE